MKPAVALRAASPVAGVAIAFAIMGLALLTYCQFPGATWLQQDTQIYTPILQHLADPAVLSRDLIVQYPHVSYTLYDELAIGLHHLTGLDFHQVLGGLQILFRALGIWGIYLLAISAGLDVWAALLTASIFSLGATIAGPSVLTFEYEPTPRAFAIPLLFCAMGLMSHRRYGWAGVIAGGALLIHAPTTVPVWLAMLWIAGRDRRKAAPLWGALAAAILILVVAAQLQPGAGAPQIFFARLTPDQETIQRLRGAYNWVSLWWTRLVGQYVVLYALGLLAYARVKADLPAEFRAFSIILPALGMLSVPGSYVLLEQLKWELVPQLQPARVLLFVTAFTVILGTMAAIRAPRLWESLGWFALVFYIPMKTQLFDPPQARQVLVALFLAAFTAAALHLPRPALAIAGASAFLVIPNLAGVSNYPQLRTPEVAALSGWAREHTGPQDVFLFPDQGRHLDSGIFRVEAERAVYVDWKSGGQVNYLKDFAVEWSKRWYFVIKAGFRDDAVPLYQDAGIDYLVLKPEHRLVSLQPVYENAHYAVYRISR